MTLEFEQRPWQDGGLYLLAAVLDRFLALHATVNSFVRTTAVLRGRSDRAAAVAGASRDAGARLTAPSPSRAPARATQRFRFDAAVRVLAGATKNADFAEKVRFRSIPGLGYPPAEISPIEAPAEDRPPRDHDRRDGLDRRLRRAAAPLYRADNQCVAEPFARRCTNFLTCWRIALCVFFARGGVKYRVNRSAEIASKPATVRPVARRALGIDRLPDPASRRQARSGRRSAAALRGPVCDPSALCREARSSRIRLVWT